MNLATAIKYVRQYRRHGKSCYIRSSDREPMEWETPLGCVLFRCNKCRYAHGGKSKWWRAYLVFANGRAVPSRDFGKLLAS